MSTFDALNEAQKKAVTFGSGPLLIVAGAGTGKTTVITQRIAWLVMEKKVPTDGILALTFTEKAASEMEERVDVLLPYGYVDLWILTFHSFCERILKDNALEIGLPPDFKLLNETDQVMLVRQNLDAFNLDYYRPLGNPTKFVQALVKHFSRAKDENVMPEEYVEYAENLKLDRGDVDYAKKRGAGDEEFTEEQRIREVANAYHVYEQLLLDNSALDFGDLILYAIKLFRTRPRVLDRYRKQFRYVLVDEFQDTNYAQYELVKLLAGDRQNVTVVGDDDQSIYKFRGAAISNILEFKKDFPNSAEVVLAENYRTVQNILDVSYAFIKQNDPNRLEYQLSQGTVDPKGAPLKHKVSKKLRSAREGDGPLSHLAFRSHLEEASGVAKKIVEIKKKNKKLQWGDFAILVRANAHANEFIAALSRLEIPYQYLASRGLYAQPEVMDVIAYLKLLDNYHESPALWRVLSFAHWDLPIEDLMAVSAYARRKSLSLYEALRTARAIRGIGATFVSKTEKILSIVEAHTQLAKTKPVLPVALQFMKDSGYLKAMTSKDSPENLEKIVHLNQFFRTIETFETANNDGSVKNFLYEFSQIQEAGDEGSMNKPWEEGPDAVRIMTIHGAKGLEFPYVFLVSLVDKRFPTVERKEQIELPDALVKEIIPEGDVHLQEERRLFYVGMTRARDGLFLTSAEDYGGTRRKKPSRFLVELGFVERAGAAEKADPTERLMPPEPATQQEIRDLSFLQKAIPAQASFTQLRAFQTCPKQYKYAHILRLPVEGRHAFSFGKSIHGALFRFFTLVRQGGGASQSDLFGAKKKKQSVPAADELLALYEAEWVDDWYLSKEHAEEYRAKGAKLLREFYNSHKGTFPVPLHLEQPFHLKLGEYTFKGVIDRIDPAGEKNQAEIIDYKTGQLPKGGKLSPDDKQQLQIYDLAVREVLGLEPTLLSYYYLDANKKLSFESDEKALRDIKAQLTSQIQSIRASEFKATPGFWCNSCDFREICEDRWRG